MPARTLGCGLWRCNLFSESNDVVELIDGENSFKAIKPGTVKAHARDGLGNDHPFEIEVVDPAEVSLSKAKFVSSDYTFPCEVSSDSISKDWLWLECDRGLNIQRAC